MTADWHDFFVATAGAAAALAGLIIVAMSVNIATIIKIPSMPSRAAATIGSLVLIVVAAVAGLIPDQPDIALGLEIVLFAAVALTLYVDAGVRITASTSEPRAPLVAKALIGPAQIIPFLVGGVLVAAGSPAGLTWVAAGVLLVFIGAVLNAWVLLVEILR